MITYHRMPAAQVAALASGLGGRDAVLGLTDAQHSKRLLLMRHLVDRYTDDRNCRAAVEVLVGVDKQAAETVADLIGDPMVGIWAVQTARRLLDGVDRNAATVAGDLAQIGAVAAAVALRAGMDAELRTMTLSGTVTLPTLGAAVLGSDGEALVRISSGRATVTCGGRRVEVYGDDPRWWDLRVLTATHGDLSGSFAIEDANPYRDCYHVPPAARLSDGEVRQWQELHSEAWRLLGEFLPERAVELAAGLRSVVPLVTKDAKIARSATVRDAFGTLGLTRPRSAAELAVTLVHEFQHSKLSGLLDLVQLYRPGGQERHPAPWKEELRPTGPLLQGIYAFLGVADVWRGLRSAPGLEQEATFEFERIRDQVAVALTTLDTSAELTSEGKKFAAYLRQAVDMMRTD